LVGALYPLEKPTHNVRRSVHIYGKYHDDPLAQNRPIGSEGFDNRNNGAIIETFGNFSGGIEGVAGAGKVIESSGRHFPVLLKMWVQTIGFQQPLPFSESWVLIRGVRIAQMMEIKRAKYFCFYQSNFDFRQ
jgi:hypothetical protein